MSRITGLWPLLAVLLACCTLFDGSTAIQCYECNSHTDSRCLDDVLPNSMKTQCRDQHTLCRKIDQMIEFKVNGLPEDRRIVRSCGWDESKYKGECYDRSGFGGIQRVCSCTGDNCNGNGHHSSSLVNVLLSSVALFILTREISAF
ncbi:uncharacterized protein [Neodiprion pinetum]|uniref:uncharacterized protein n=1 Tax=Neodiprion pinetum TaxID=441929 RepID=UPI001EDF54FF|nr:uncharacterized protein LOC124219063 [Neodiprion pinetum]